MSELGHFGGLPIERRLLPIESAPFMIGYESLDQAAHVADGTEGGDPMHGCNCQRKQQLQGWHSRRHHSESHRTGGSIVLESPCQGGVDSRIRWPHSVPGCGLLVGVGYFK